MYGMVNNAIRSMIIEHYGKQKWEDVHAASRVEDEVFISMNSNPDEPTYNMVVSASEILKCEVDDLLEEVGEYWLLYTAKEGYGEMLEMFGNDLYEFLQNLNHLHSRVGSVMPEFQPPTFECEQNANGSVNLHYHSDRPGLGALVVGILRGLSKKFDQPCIIQKVVAKGDGAGHDIFEIKPIS